MKEISKLIITTANMFLDEIIQEQWNYTYVMKCLEKATLTYFMVMINKLWKWI